MSGSRAWRPRFAAALGGAVLLLAACTSGSEVFDAGPVDVGPVDDFPPGSVTSFAYADGRQLARTIDADISGVEGLPEDAIVFHLVRLDDGQFRALYATDPLRGCMVPWRPDFEFEGQQGWFRNPCHGATYDIAGRRVFGPGPRDLDRFPVEVRDGRVLVTLDLDDLILGEAASQFSGGATPEPAATRQPTELAPTPTGQPTALSQGAVLSDGIEGYDYRPQLAYVDANGDAWLVDADGGSRVLLIAGCGGLEHPKDPDATAGGLVWSADGSRLACTRADGAVLTATADGSDRTRLWDAGCFAPSLSPDGTRAACQVGASTTVQIVDADGRALGEFETAFRPAELAWSPTGRHLLYPAPDRYVAASGRAKVTHRIVDADGRSVALIDDARAGRLGRFAWTLDGLLVAFPSDAGLSVLDLGSGERRAVDTSWLPEARWGFGPAVVWMRDETALLVDALAGPNAVRAIFLDATTGAPLESPLSGRTPWAAPDGRLVAFAWPRGEGIVELVDLVEGIATAVEGALFSYRGEGDGPMFVFSGDSRRLCWFENVGGTGADPVFCAQSDGSALIEVTAPVIHPPGRPFDGEPDWTQFSPDLTKIAYTLPGPDDSAAAQTLWIANLDGGHAVEIGPAVGAFPFAWRTDGVYRQRSRE